MRRNRAVLFMAKPLLTNEDFCRASKRLKCEVAAIKAVANTESAGKGFYDDGFPVILFERHLFRKFTQGRYNAQFPEISGPAGNYGAAGANQRRKFSLAFSLNPDAAMKSCSWGKFQILGSNFAVCGFKNVGEMVDAMKESEGRHLDAFVSFVIGNGLATHLHNLNWASFAKGYNGAGYRKNNYDGKMATAYAKFAKENIDCSQVSATGTPIALTAPKPNETPKPIENPAIPPVVDPPEIPASLTPPEAPNQEIVSVPPVQTEIVDNGIIGKFRTWYAALPAFILSAAGGFWSWLQGAATEIIVAFLASAGVVAIVFVITNYKSRQNDKQRQFDAEQKQKDRDFELTKIQLMSAADPNKQTVRLSPPAVVVPEVE